jgi:transposase-like protein
MTDEYPSVAGITAKMYAAYSTPLSVAEVAQQFGCNTATVYRWFHKGGYKLRPRHRNPHRRGGGREIRRGYSTESYKRNLAGLQRANLDRSDIAAEVTVEAAKAALPTATPHAAKILQCRIDHPTLTSLTELSEICGPVTKHAVAGVLRRARLQHEERTYGRRSSQ